LSDLSTTNYGWIKPTVGSDADTWGGIQNGTLDAQDSLIGNIASIIGIAGTEIINLSSSVTGISSSLGNLTTSVSGLSVTVGSHTTELASVSSSLTTATAGVAGLTSSLATTNTNVAAVSSSLTGVSSSLSSTNANVTGLSTSLAGVSTSLGNVSTSLAALPQAGTNANSAGYLGLPQATQTLNYTAVIADAGKEQLFTASGKTATIPANASVAYQIGTVLVFSILSGSLTVAITSDTMTWVPAGTTGSRTVTGPGFLIARKISATNWLVYGLGVT
jgi:hypothetical protein